METEKTKGMPKPLRTSFSAREATLMLNHPQHTCQVFAALLAQISKGAPRRKATDVYKELFLYEQSNGGKTW